MPYAKIEPSGCGEFHGNVKIRLAFYLEPDDVGYEKHHVYIPVIPPEGYQGKVDKFGNPVNQADYDAWLDGLPHVWQNNPFHNHFLYFDPDVTEEELQKVASFHLPNFYKAWCDGRDNVPGGMRHGWYRGLLNDEGQPADIQKFLSNADFKSEVSPARYEFLDTPEVFSLRKVQCLDKAEELKTLDVKATSKVNGRTFTFPTVAAVNGGNDTSNGTNHTVNLPADISAGDMLLVFFASDGDVTITFPGGWNQLFHTANGTACTVGAWYKIADGGEGASITATTSASQMTAHTSYRLESAHAFTITAGTPATGTSVNPNPPSLSRVTKDYTWFAVCGYDRNKTASAYPTNYTNGRNDLSNNVQGVGVGTAYRNLATDSEDPGTFTISASEEWVANTICISNAEIDVGSAAIDRGGNFTVYSGGTYNTLIDYNNAANDTGALDTVEAYADIADAGNSIKFGTFMDNGSASFTCNDAEVYGEVSLGHNSCTGLDIAVSSGEYLGCDARAAYVLKLDRAFTGGGGLYYVAGQFCDPSDTQTFTLLSGDIISLYGTGETAGPIEKTGSDTASSVDALVPSNPQATLSVLDTGSGVDSLAAANPIATISKSDTGSGVDAYTLLSKLIEKLTSDTGSGVEGTPVETSTLAGSETGSGAEISSLLASLLGTGETGSGVDAPIALDALLSLSDTGSGVEGLLDRLFGVSDSGSLLDASVSQLADLLGDESLSGLDSLKSLLAELSSAESMSGISVSTIEAALTAIDSLAGADAVIALINLLLASDTGVLLDAVLALTQTLTSIDSGTFTESAGKMTPSRILLILSWLLTALAIRSNLKTGLTVTSRLHTGLSIESKIKGG